ncbi:MAG: alpha/beta hydrolase [Rhodothermales bacterium]
MKTLYCAVLSLLTASLVATSSLKAQPIPTGEWTGFVTPPGGGPLLSTLEVTGDGDELDVVMEIETHEGEFEFQDIHFVDDVLRFWWAPIMRVDCEVNPDEEGVYRGLCRDGDGNTGPFVMVPPHMHVNEILDEMRAEEERQRLEAEKWAARRALDELDGPRGEMYDVGGYELNALVQGAGNVTVVLISDVGDDLRTWDYVADDVKEFARVVSYSRAGIGYTDESGASKSLPQSASELRALLRRAELPPPYVVVGHAFGTAFATAFASAYPDVVEGLVFVEPVHPEEGEWWSTLDPDGWDTYWSQRSALFDMAPDPVRSEFELYAQLLEEGRLDGMDTLPDVPAIVVSSTRVPDTVRWPGESSEGIEAKLRMHEELASSIEGARHFAADDSGQYVHRENPDLVVQAIKEVVRQIQGDASSNY